MKSYRTVMICFLLEIMWKDYFDTICMKGAKERLFRTDFFFDVCIVRCRHSGR